MERTVYRTNIYVCVPLTDSQSRPGNFHRYAARHTNIRLTPRRLWKPSNGESDTLLGSGGKLGRWKTLSNIYIGETSGLGSGVCVCVFL